ncbi:PIN domain-containing protein [Saccharolobus solfataricus]|nr:type II toxin-antitoxin system VapC family toxin [Saccharolobus solfataricus]AKA74691.1 PIN domain-containing protein [Saccharolobus solfataricus]AKA77385.1 PIN domain-containing protein [Saccharolobus solfataricus]AKA80076.1 PIN domain-containing protein [Saccharolobus solfataricus]AZF69155.1 PIN domain-containing protein [Saccharolobus solfataricus]AZF71775.1 PIN domain-containing protein [Saccharolobus solfataricus]
MIDSNVFIYVLFSDPSYGERAKELLNKAENEDAYSSTLIISQVLAHLERRRKSEIIPVFINYIQQSGIKILETRWEDVIEAIKLLRNMNLSYNLWDDAIISAQIKREKIDIIFSNDKDFDILQVKREF